MACMVGPRRLSYKKTSNIAKFLVRIGIEIDPTNKLLLDLETAYQAGERGEKVAMPPKPI